MEVLERGERLIQHALAGIDVNFFDLASCLRHGFPAERIFRLLESDDFQHVYLGLLTLSETYTDSLCRISERLTDVIAERIEFFQDNAITHCGLEAIARFASIENTHAVWLLLSYLESDFAEPVFHFLESVDNNLMEAVKNYLLRVNPVSKHLKAIQFFLEHCEDIVAVEQALDHPEVVMQRYAAAMAFRFFDSSNTIRDKLGNIQDDLVQWVFDRRNSLDLFGNPALAKSQSDFF